jgi:hypothetical protein
MLDILEHKGFTSIDRLQANKDERHAEIEVAAENLAEV